MNTDVLVIWTPLQLRVQEWAPSRVLILLQFVVLILALWCSKVEHPFLECTHLKLWVVYEKAEWNLPLWAVDCLFSVFVFVHQKKIVTEICKILKFTHLKLWVARPYN